MIHGSIRCIWKKFSKNLTFLDIVSLWVNHWYLWFVTVTILFFLVLSRELLEQQLLTPAFLQKLLIFTTIHNIIVQCLCQKLTTVSIIHLNECDSQLYDFLISTINVKPKIKTWSRAGELQYQWNHFITAATRTSEKQSKKFIIKPQWNLNFL